jgi:diguanylate cyclase (GGDEF)-like protein/PAS domain S-box-containing protein
MKLTVFRDRHFYILLILFVVCTVLYYFGELVILLGWEALRWDIFYTVHDPHRMLFLAPILYASFNYRVRGAVLADAAALFIFLPRAFLISPYPDATLRMLVFMAVAVVLSIFTANTINLRDKRTNLIGALKRSEEKNRQVLEQMYDSYYEMDKAGKYVFVNDSVCRSLGYTRAELIGSDYRLTVHGDDIKRVQLAFSDVFRTGEPNKGFEHKVLCKDGSIITVESSISLRRNEHGDVIGFRSISRDVTEREQAEFQVKERMKELGAFYSLGEITAREDITLDEVYREVTNILPASWQYPEITCARMVMSNREFRTDNFADPAWTQTAPVMVWGLATGRIEVGYLEEKPVMDEGPFMKEERTLLNAIADRIGHITERRQAEEAMRAAEEKYRSLVENINDVFYMLDNKGTISYISPVVERMTLYKVSELVGKSIFPLIHPEDLPGLLDSINHLESGRLKPWEFRIFDKDGRIIYVRASRQLLYKGGKVIGITAVMSDITERKQMEQKLEEMATHDNLTGLPNRVLLADRFRIAAALARRNKAKLAVMSLDLDKFKNINDTLGHDAGDQVLKTIGMRLTGIIRASDTLARVGGDEFILLMLETNRVEDSGTVAQKILDCFAVPLTIEGHKLSLSTSIGVAVYPDDSADMETLTKQSDAAMYYSKGHGRNRYKFFGDGDVSIGGDHKSGN